jgi:hypothetical protein
MNEKRGIFHHNYDTDTLMYIIIYNVEPERK